MNMVIEYSKYFKNFDLINNFSFNKADYISEMLVKNYKTTIYNFDINNSIQMKKIKKIDEIMKKYIMEKDFYIFIQNRIENYFSNDIQDLNEILIIEYENFEKNINIKVETSRWI